MTGHPASVQYEATLAKWMNPRGLNLRIDVYPEPTIPDDMVAPTTVRNEVYLADLQRRLPLLQAMRHAALDDDFRDHEDNDAGMDQ